MEKTTADLIRKIYAVIVWVEAALLFIVSIGLVFGGTLLSAMMDAQMASMMDIPDVLVGQVIGAAGVAIGIVVLLVSILYVFIGSGLWKRQNWARIALLVLCVLSLFSFPIGTLLGAFGIWFFGFSTEGKGTFRIDAPAAPATPTKPAVKKKK